METFLRPWQPGDAADLLRARHSHPDLDSQFGGVSVDDEVAAAAFIAETLQFSDRSKNWAIVADGIAVGNVGLAVIERRHDTAWAHYWLAAAARGNGLAARAIISVADFAFRDGLFRLELGHRVNNPASCAVALRAGFIAEGIERQKLRYGSERFDVETHSRLATDPHPTGDGLAVVDR